jgi:hypothetical protein
MGRQFWLGRCRSHSDRLLFEHTAQFDRHGLPPREGHRHIGHEPANIAGELAVGIIALGQLVSMAEVGVVTS